MMLKGRFVVPVDGPVIEHGAVIIHNDRITAIGRSAELSHQETIDYGDAVICPGFVNAHTHLELSSLAGLIPTAISAAGDPTLGFIDWLMQLMDAIGTTPPDAAQLTGAMRSGIAESLASGVTMLGDVTRNPAQTRRVLAESALRGVSFGEISAIGRRRHLLSERLSAASCRAGETGRFRTGVSPHSPYTVEPDAMRACADAARQGNIPLSIHLAETPGEESFTRTGTGPFADYLERLGVWDEAIPVAGCSPVELAFRTGLLNRRTVIAHANYVSDPDIALIRESGASVAYCPRTHAAFGHQPHPFRLLLEAGVNVCLGTDSLASTPSLSILDELRFLHEGHPDLAPETLIEIGTIRGARALGFAPAAGSISIGSSADLVVVPLDPTSPHDRWDRILESAAPPIAVYTNGTLLPQHPHNP